MKTLVTQKKTENPDEDRDSYVNNCLLRAAQTTDRQERQALLDEAVLNSLSVADALARRYHNRGASSEDLVQVARLSLVTAVNRFDPTRGTAFLSFAVPTITGDLRKHFRDQTWSIRPPRRLQEAHLKIRVAVPELTQELGRTPTAAEIAERCEVEPEVVEEAEQAADGHNSLSLERAQGGGDEQLTLADSIGAPDQEYDRCEARIMLRPLIERLDGRERKVIELRYLRGLTQREVGEQIGVSQMQVSRILRRTLDRMRAELEAVPAA